MLSIKNKNSILLITVITILLIIGYTVNSYSQPSVLWSKIWGGSTNKNDCGYDCVSDGTSYLYITGSVKNSNPSNDHDVVAIKYNQSTGDTVWTRIYNGPNNKDEEGNGCVLGSDGYLYVVGYTDISTTNDKDDQLLLIKYNTSNGTIIWAKNFGISTGNPIPDEGGISCATDGTYLYVAGFYYDGTNYMKIWKFNYNGDTVWSKQYTDAPESVGSGCAVDNSGYIYISGYAIVGGNIKLALWKYNSSGTFQWIRYSSDTMETSIHNDFTSCTYRDNNIFVTGLAGTSVNRYGITMKYANTGDTIWVKRNDSPSTYDQNHRCNTDIKGDVYVAATRYNGTNDDWAVLKYKGSDGTLLWTIIYNYTTNNSDYAIGCSLDNTGNLYVTGMVNFNLENSDIYTVKYQSSVGIKKINETIPANFSLSQNYPNPFNPSTNIKFEIPKQEMVKLTIFDALGRELKTLVDENLAPGIYEVRWDASAYSSGIYFYRLTAGDYTKTNKMILIK